jgi:hypothetical protein
VLFSRGRGADRLGVLAVPPLVQQLAGTWLAGHRVTSMVA